VKKKMVACCVCPTDKQHKNSSYLYYSEIQKMKELVTKIYFQDVPSVGAAELLK
jgi:hypothetical protein